MLHWKLKIIMLPDFSEERQLWSSGYNLVIGVDEVGRGSFAGPVVASACAFVPQLHTSDFILHNSSARIDDSKRLKPNERKKAAKWIRENCLAYGIGEVNVPTINKVGIGKATAIAMRRAAYSVLHMAYGKKNYIRLAISNKPFLLIDAFYINYMRGIPKAQQKPIIRGDQKSISIASASIMAKVYRDSLMQRLSKQHPSYQWGRNKGYGTRNHQEAIVKHGLTRLHRIAFVEAFLSRPTSAKVRTKGLSF